LKGKKIAFEYKGVEEFLLRFALKKVGIGIDDITSVDLSPTLAAEALVAGKVDAAVTYEPSLSKAVKTETVNVIYSTVQDPGIIIDLLVMKSDFIDKYPQTVKGIVAGYFEGFKYYQDNPSEAYAIVGGYLNDSPKNIESGLKGIQLLNLLENEVILTGKEGSQSLRENLKMVLEFVLRERGILFANILPESLIESKFVEAFYKTGNGNK
jgi:NitT/TauT family transport system substrate-binding protein